MVLSSSLAGTGIRAADSGVDEKERTAVVNRAVAYLRTRQNADGSFAPRLAGPGVSAVVAAGLIRNGVTTDEPLLNKTLAYLESKVQPDGGVYEQSDGQLHDERRPGGLRRRQHRRQVRRGHPQRDQFLQYPPGRRRRQGRIRRRPFGGLGYDGKCRPDLSNTQFFPRGPAGGRRGQGRPGRQAGLVFVNRCQNLPGEHNDQPFAAKTTDDDRGGLVYNPIDADKNDRDRTPQGGLRSAGAMTYGGLKSFLYAGVTKDDPRVQGAIKWIRAHYTLDENPGMGKAGLFYYYHTFAKAMTALGEDRFTDAKGVAHDWRRELFEALKKRQRPTAVGSTTATAPSASRTRNWRRRSRCWH